MFTNVLLPTTQNFLENITKTDLPNSTYLAGGTAIALHLGHRKSFDLDFFTQTEFNEVQWEQKFINNWNFEIIQRDWRTLIGNIKKVKFSLFYYKYKLIEETSKIAEVNIASLPDLAAMKLDTIIARGAKRDFIDIYFLAKKFGMDKLFEFYDKKYGNFEEKELMIKKSLVYFQEADNDEMPNMLIDLNWEEVKRFFTEQTR